MFFDVSVEESTYTGDDKGKDEHYVTVDPDIVGVVVVIGPVYFL